LSHRDSAIFLAFGSYPSSRLAEHASRPPQNGIGRANQSQLDEASFQVLQIEEWIAERSITGAVGLPRGRLGCVPYSPASMSWNDSLKNQRPCQIAEIKNRKKRIRKSFFESVIDLFQDRR
jgi:hypothetical protein